MLRCLVCGCSRFDPKGYKCALCGGAHGVRSEQCYVTDDTKAKLRAQAEELRNFGVALEEREVLHKGAGDVATYVGLALAVADSLNSGVLRKLVMLLWKVGIPKDEILRLRLDEPEAISEILSADEPEQPQKIDK